MIRFYRTTRNRFIWKRIKRHEKNKQRKILFLLFYKSKNILLFHLLLLRLLSSPPRCHSLVVSIIFVTIIISVVWRQQRDPSTGFIYLLNRTLQRLIKNRISMWISSSLIHLICRLAFVLNASYAFVLCFLLLAGFSSTSTSLSPPPPTASLCFADIFVYLKNPTKRYWLTKQIAYGKHRIVSVLLFVSHRHHSS